MTFAVFALPVLLALSPTSPAPTGSYHAKLEPVAGHDVAFGLAIAEKRNGLSATILNGPDRLAVSKASWDGKELVLELSHLDARLVLTPQEGGALAGTFTRVTAAQTVELAVTARKEAPALPARVAQGTMAGEWNVSLGAAGKAEALEGVFTQQGVRVFGTLRSATGDYGPLHGTFDGRDLVLTVFDGVHVYRIAASTGDGGLSGEFRSRASAPVPITFRRKARGEASLDASALVKAKDPAAPLRLSHPDEKGVAVSLDDPRFAGKALIVSTSGTWCPNCNDEAKVLVDLYARHRSKGLEIVSVFYEYTDDVERSRRQVSRFRERYGIRYTTLLAGTTKTAKDTPLVLALDGWQGYPTTLFLDRQHRIVKTHSGFDGPATGVHHTELLKEMERTVKEILRSKP
ncbi:MAG: TlpA family protein disulfide reductase [Acidobacteria bacterium]|nr:TlpA family protein disulfide reductase [Acidobacteriota bacterium]